MYHQPVEHMPLVRKSYIRPDFLRSSSGTLESGHPKCSIIDSIIFAVKFIRYFQKYIEYNKIIYNRHEIYYYIYIPSSQFGEFYLSPLTVCSPAPPIY